MLRNRNVSYFFKDTYLIVHIPGFKLQLKVQSQHEVHFLLGAADAEGDIDAVGETVG